MLSQKSGQAALPELVKTKLLAVAAGKGPARRAVDPGRIALARLPVCEPPARVASLWESLFKEASKVTFQVALTLLRRHQASILKTNSAPDISRT